MILPNESEHVTWRHLRAHTYTQLIFRQLSHHCDPHASQPPLGNYTGGRTNPAKANLMGEEGAKAQDGDGWRERREWGVSRYIQWAEIDRERKRWIMGGREIVRDPNGYMAS